MKEPKVHWCKKSVFKLKHGTKEVLCEMNRWKVKAVANEWKFVSCKNCKKRKPPAK